MSERPEMGGPRSTPDPPRTPAGERVKEWFRRNATFVSRPLDALDFDEIARVALDRIDFSGEERDAVDADVASQLASALKTEFGGFMRTTDDEWLATARSLLARMQARTMVMNVNLMGDDPVIVNGIFMHSDVDGTKVFPRSVFYMPSTEVKALADSLTEDPKDPDGEDGR